MRTKLDDVRRLYSLLDTLERRTGGKRQLAQCSGKLNWPRRGLYSFFESGEERSSSGTGPRVVRVGTHALTSTSRTTLWHRLSQHRGSSNTGGGNHRGSIFRLLVGEALANRDQVIALESWGQGSSATAAVRAHELEHEKRVSGYIGAMQLLWLETPDVSGSERLRGVIERNAIGLLSNYAGEPLDAASPNWLGHFSLRIKVRRSGLWNQNHVDESYDRGFLNEFERLANGE